MLVRELFAEEQTYKTYDIYIDGQGHELAGMLKGVSDKIEKKVNRVIRAVNGTSDEQLQFTVDFAGTEEQLEDSISKILPSYCTVSASLEF